MRVDAPPEQRPIKLGPAYLISVKADENADSFFFCYFDLVPDRRRIRSGRLRIHPDGKSADPLRKIADSSGRKVGGSVPEDCGFIRTESRRMRRTLNAIAHVSSSGTSISSQSVSDNLFCPEVVVPSLAVDSASDGYR